MHIEPNVYMCILQIMSNLITFGKHFDPFVFFFLPLSKNEL